VFLHVEVSHREGLDPPPPALIITEEAISRYIACWLHTTPDTTVRIVFVATFVHLSDGSVADPDYCRDRKRVLRCVMHHPCARPSVFPASVIASGPWSGQMAALRQS
jgi:hypothetical protein